MISFTTIETTYEGIIDELKKGHRPRLKLTKDQTQACLDFATQNRENKENIKKLLCVLDHCDHNSLEISHFYIQSLLTNDDQELQSYFLSGSLTHVIFQYQKRGERLPFDYLQGVEKSLTRNNPEELEWALRCIEAMGAQGVFFKQKVLASKPSMLKIFNKHAKAARQIIEYLEKRWEAP